MFVKILDRPGGLGVMARPGGELAIPKRAQFAADRLRADRDAEFFPDPLGQIGQPSAHHAMHGGKRPALDHRRQGLPLGCVQSPRRTRRLAVDQAVGAARVEFHHPVAHDLQAHPADPRRVAARAAVVDRRQRQPPPRLIRVAGPPRALPKISRGEVRTQRQGGTMANLVLFAPFRITSAPRPESPA